MWIWRFQYTEFVLSFILNVQISSAPILEGIFYEMNDMLNKNYLIRQTENKFPLKKDYRCFEHLTVVSKIIASLRVCPCVLIKTEVSKGPQCVFELEELEGWEKR